ncbi:MBL fold metallo-hydrolase [Methanococcus maripaludis]|uniref:Phosphoribosyl 1,2-cyclic phosphodiesterase n=1 Tax=Methanococcus maripaludis TaxID=39152 RepID=A0A2L1CC03_METMI|nr:MBL fold metallo-hydrolase [Methanococcus maripaludis]AVB76874.1 ribonuclease Z [Methanococcus maripaludis]MBA2863384.1 phosphoribosyl 1,2-cyclic phosphodiesterase [Methanococcus maripaludis]MBB6496612.1 phosphoribosyl 1,2-cyclic phosphodiesterase [Methanococcus maripaludis]
MLEIVFLGGGGGRWESITQVKGTGGFRIHSENMNMHVDPGTGALVRMNQLQINPWKTDAIIATHCHPDHYTDAECLVEAMTKGMTKKQGILIGNNSVLNGNSRFEKGISTYHQSRVGERHVLGPCDELNIKNWNITATKTKHNDPETIGFKMEIEDGIIGYTSDSEYIDSLIEDFDSVDFLIANVIRVKGQKVPGHMCSNDIIEVVNSMNKKPKMLTMYHMGMKMTDPDSEARYISKNVDIPVIPAKIGLKVILENKTCKFDYITY